MSRLVRLLSLPLLAMAVLALALPASAAPAAPSDVGPVATSGLLGDRKCDNFPTGDKLRMLSVCVNNWVKDTTATQWRGVVEMHTYRSNGAGGWVDSTSQSITVNRAYFWGNGGLKFSFGNDVSGTTCRVNGASSSWIACSVPNTHVVDFYGAAYDGVLQTVETCVARVSWRDDRGQAHYVDRTNFPSAIPLCDLD